MSTQKKTGQTPPKKLVPRTAPKADVLPDPKVLTGEPVVVVAAVPVAPPVAESVAESVEELVADVLPPATSAAITAAAPKAKAVRKPSALDVVKARNKKALSDALAKAQAVKITQPLGQSVPAPDLPKAAKPAKVRKAKLVRDSYAMPDTEYAQLAVLKKRILGLDGTAKKSELLRAGIALLSALNDAELQAVMGRVERIKTGRPAK